jgi:lipopolysaccharide biosynthesis glycosyltransferase
MLTRDKAEINIVTSCDNAYAQHTTVFLKSLFQKNQNIRKIFILVPNNFIHRRSLERNLSSHVRCLEFLTINLPENASFKVSHHITVASYFRLVLDQVVPASIGRVIYLDSDVLINGPLDELWAVDLQNYMIAAVSDSIVGENRPLREEIGKRIGLAPTSNYFNAGVLAIDLCRWRNARLGKRALDFVLDYPDMITYWDQCALNHVVRGQFKELAKEWNFQTNHLRWSANRKCTRDSLREVDAAKIVHFVGSRKPWLYRTNHPMKWLYWEYLRQTEWHDYCPPDRNALNVLRKIIRKRAPALLNVIGAVTFQLPSDRLVE